MGFLGHTIHGNQYKPRSDATKRVCSGPTLFATPLQKHAYSNIWKISLPKPENFLIKNSDNFHISTQNINCGYSLEPPRLGGSNGYPQSML